ncbi:MAG: sulfite exporter TauE/SafE family protein [Thermoflexales bacterium]|nr:sulfite exporter TauE/SafE family protein [Thermoflexales bacterium]MCS7324340.1 sulfite exporter TauE/SafE family protein [Thermoflexales bacterium]MCX7939456.1 sulfite exporter TauE/SafE family protein [Thermoflexales bacterium]MDW8054841.1 sulfite exporter TauE/SafE family protein [Anaerolineae bacterium]MDW8293046.1 sulfite exporter TauE/SafE family protein [Anaerolineae bacterium]
MTLSSLLVDLALGFAIGITLGLLGGGGSILTVPALVYVVGITPQAAVTASLVIVGLNSALGALMHRSQGTLNWRVALVFGGVGMLASFLAANASRSVSPHVLLTLFALLMLVIGGWMLFVRLPADAEGTPRGWLAVLGGGAAVGALTGFLGVGGGFLIVPALVLLVGLPMKQAVGTSLIVITMNSAAGFLGHLASANLDVVTTGVFVVAGFVGAFVGARLVQRLSAHTLRQVFALFVVGLGLFLLGDNVRHLL